MCACVYSPNGFMCFVHFSFFSFSSVTYRTIYKFYHTFIVFQPLFTFPTNKNTTHFLCSAFGGNRGIRRLLRILDFACNASSVNSLKKLHWSFFFTLVALSGSNHLCFWHKKTLHISCVVPLAETEGFEPSRPLRTLTV